MDRTDVDRTDMDRTDMDRTDMDRTDVDRTDGTGPTWTTMGAQTGRGRHLPSARAQRVTSLMVPKAPWTYAAEPAPLEASLPAGRALGRLRQRLRERASARGGRPMAACRPLL